MKNLYTNRNQLGDFGWNAFTMHGKRCNVQIATAFFSNSELIQELVSRQCTVQMVIRLGQGTSPDALLQCVSIPGIRIRYFTGAGFHPKLYIFGGTCCLLGSANLTTNGMRSNQEVSVLLPADDPRFDELSGLFVDFWNQAKVLDRAEAERFKRTVSSVAKRTEPDVDQAVRDTFGHHSFANIGRDEKPIKKRDAYLESYRRRYQEFRDAFTEVRDIYVSLGKRLVSESDLPLRIEVDRFLNFVRVELGAGDSYRGAPVLQGAQRESRIEQAIHQFQTANPTSLREAAEARYPRIHRVLATQTGIESASEDELYGALLMVHAFHDRLRFFDGGEPTMKKEFLAENGINRIKYTISYLVHGSEKDYVTRMADCIFDPGLRLQDFGESCVQETFGWINGEGAPICNGRALKGLRWLGFDLKVA